MIRYIAHTIHATYALVLSFNASKSKLIFVRNVNEISDKRILFNETICLIEEN